MDTRVSDIRQCHYGHYDPISYPTSDIMAPKGRPEQGTFVLSVRDRIALLDQLGDTKWSRSGITAKLYTGMGPTAPTPGPYIQYW